MKINVRLLIVLISVPVIAFFLHLIRENVDERYVWAVVPGVFLTFLLDALYKGRALKSSMMDRNAIFCVRASYSNDKGLYVLADFGDNKIITVFFKEHYHSLPVGHYYVWNGENLNSHKDC